MRTPILAFVILLLLSGRAEAQLTPGLLPPAFPTVHMGTPEGVSPIMPGSLPEEEREAFVRASFEAYRALHQAVISAPMWHDADEAVQAEIERHPAVPRYVLEQQAAAYMLHGYILHSQGADAAAAAERYTRDLAFNGSPDAELIESAILAHGDHWSPSSRRAIASVAAESAQTYVTKRADCGECSFEDILGDADPAAPAHLLAVASAARRLTEIAAD